MKLVFVAAALCASAAIGLGQSHECATVEKCREALQVNARSSAVHYRIGEIFFLEKNYQASANSFRQALNGDLDPKWTAVWSHVSLGKIFDVLRHRDRAVNEYRLAIGTKDNTRGALDEAEKYLQAPYSGN